MGMRRKGDDEIPIVQTGEVPTIIATGVIAVDRGDGFFDVTFCHDHSWGGTEVQERQVTGLVHMTERCWEQFLRIAAAIGMTIEMQAATAH